MKRVLKEFLSTFTDSPALWLSLICCCWAYVRIVLYQFGISSRAPLVELTLVALIGVVAGLGALQRDREQIWYLGLVTMGLNVMAWWLRLMQVDWAAIRSSFDS